MLYNSIYVQNDQYFSQIPILINITETSFLTLYGILIAIEATERIIKVDEDENAICRNEGNRTSLSLDRICMQIRDGFELPRRHNI